jgi:translocation and assembly module TamA
VLVLATALLPAIALEVASARQPGFLDRITSWFSRDRKTAPVADAVPYRTTVTVPGASRSLRKAIADASNLDTLESTPPSGAAGLARRALSDYQRLTAALYANGYYGGTILILVAGRPADSENILNVIDAARKTGPVPVKITVTPGPLFRFGTVRILDAHTHEPLRDMPGAKALKIVEGDEAKATLINAAEAVITGKLRDEGHPFARVADKDVVADHARRRVDIAFYVEAGPVATMGPVSISGNEGVKTSFIRNRVKAIRPGDPYSPKVIERVRKDIASHDIFASVRIVEADHLDPNGQLPLSVEVTERKPRYIGFGAKYSSTDGSTINGYWGHRNLFGGGETLRLDAQASWYGDVPDSLPDQDPFGYKFTATFTKPDIITTQDELLAEASVFREVTDAYIRKAITLTSGIRHKFNDELSVQAGVDFEAAHTVTATYDRNDLIVGIPIDVAYDSTDNPVDPAKGIRATGRFEPFALLGNAGSGPLLFQGSFATYRALDAENRYILAGRVTAGTLIGASLDDMPPQRRFYVGGGGTLRGFGYQEASPRDAAGNIIGGLSFLTASLEARMKVTDTIGIVPFLDAGAAFAGRVPDLSQLRYSAGLGLRYYTGIGPVRLDVAFPLNRRPDDARYGIYVSLGQSF